MGAAHRNRSVAVVRLGRKHPEADAHGAQAVQMARCQPGVEIVPVASSLFGPARLGQRAKAGIPLILHETFGTVEQFRPLGRLDAEDQFRTTAADSRIVRVERIDAARIDQPCPCMSSLPPALLHVDIAVLGGHHHDGLPGANGFGAGRCVFPRIDERALVRSVVLEHLVPRRAAFACFADDRFEPANEVALNFGDFPHALGLHQGLAPGTVAPVFRADLVASYVNVFRRKQGGQLGQDVAQHREVLLPPGAQHVAHLFGRIVFAGLKAERFGVDARQSLAMARQVDLGNDLHGARCGEAHDLAHVVLREIAAVAPLARSVRGR